MSVIRLTLHCLAVAHLIMKERREDEYIVFKEEDRCLELRRGRVDFNNDLHHVRIPSYNNNGQHPPLFQAELKGLDCSMVQMHSHMTVAFTVVPCSNIA